jgi:uncharacterized membrane protein YidH (DUF202 family)
VAVFSTPTKKLKLATFIHALKIAAILQWRSTWLNLKGKKSNTYGNKMTEFIGLVIMVFSVFMTGLLLGQAGKK